MLTKLLAVSALILMVGCTTLSERDEILSQCDAASRSMKVVKNYVVDGTLKDPDILRSVQKSIPVIVEICTNPDNTYENALLVLKDAAVKILTAQLYAEAN